MSMVSYDTFFGGLKIPEFGKLGGTDPAKGPFSKGFAFLAAVGAHGTIASSLAISFASRVV